MLGSFTSHLSLHGLDLDADLDSPCSIVILARLMRI